MPDHPLSRRSFLCLAGAAVLSPAQVWASSQPVRSLWLIRSETKEEVRADYLQNGYTNPDSYAKICVLLRDVRANKAMVMDRDLIDSLFLIQAWLAKNGHHQPLMVNSGYRTESTNRSIEGAAKHSLHTVGEAADIWVPDLRTDSLRDLVASFGIGGVGFYPSKKFIHVDSGTVKTWRGA